MIELIVCSKLPTVLNDDRKEENGGDGQRRDNST